VLDITYPVLHTTGIVIAVYERLDDDEPKLLVWSEESTLDIALKMSDQEILERIKFAERFFTGRLHRTAVSSLAQLNS
jgi:hypothetical protein